MDKFLGGTKNMIALFSFVLMVSLREFLY